MTFKILNGVQRMKNVRILCAYCNNYDSPRILFLVLMNDKLCKILRYFQCLTVKETLADGS